MVTPLEILTVFHASVPLLTKLIAPFVLVAHTAINVVAETKLRNDVHFSSAPFGHRLYHNRRSVTFESAPLSPNGGEENAAEAPPNWLFSTLRRHFKKTTQ